MNKLQEKFGCLPIFSDPQHWSDTQVVSGCQFWPNRGSEAWLPTSNWCAMLRADLAGQELWSLLCASTWEKRRWILVRSSICSWFKAWGQESNMVRPYDSDNTAQHTGIYTFSIFQYLSVFIILIYIILYMINMIIWYSFLGGTPSRFAMVSCYCGLTLNWCRSCCSKS